MTTVLGKALALVEEVKVVRHVRTPEGMRRYHQPIGSIIVGKHRLNNLQIIGDHPLYLDMVVVQDHNGNKYDISKYDNEWWATEHQDEGWGKDILKAPTKDELYTKLDEHVGRMALNEPKVVAEVKPSKQYVHAGQAIKDALDGYGVKFSDYRTAPISEHGERVGTIWTPSNQHAEVAIAEHADDIERDMESFGWPVRVDVSKSKTGRPNIVIRNYGLSKPGKRDWKPSDMRGTAVAEALRSVKTMAGLIPSDSRTQREKFRSGMSKHRLPELQTALRNGDLYEAEKLASDIDFFEQQRGADVTDDSRLLMSAIQRRIKAAHWAKWKYNRDAEPGGDYDPSNPLAVYGKAIVIEDESDRSYKYLYDLERYMPSDVHALYANRLAKERKTREGYENAGIYVAGDASSIVDVDHLQDYSKREKSNGTWDSRTDWAQVAGVHVGGRGVVALASDEHSGSESMALHEAGHQMDLLGYGLHYQPMFTAPYSTMNRDAMPYFNSQYNGENWAAEAFAELFATWAKYRNTDRLTSGGLGLLMMRSIGIHSMDKQEKHRDAMQTLISYFRTLSDHWEAGQ